MKQEFNVIELYYIDFCLEQQIAAAEAIFNRDLDRTTRAMISKQIQTCTMVRKKVSNYIKEGVKNEENGSDCV